MTTKTTKTIYTKLIEVQKEGFKVTKDGNNPHFKSAYVTLDALNNTLLPLANAQWLSITHINRVEGDFVTLDTIVTDVETNEQITSSFPIFAQDPQKIGSAITYGKRYNLGAIFNIITEVDDDGNSVSGENFKKNEVRQVEDDGKAWFAQENLVAMAKIIGNYANEDDAVKDARKKYKVAVKFADAIKHLHKTGEVITVK